jgi:hypothetical protein
VASPDATAIVSSSSTSPSARALRDEQPDALHGDVPAAPEAGGQRVRAETEAARGDDHRAADAPRGRGVDVRLEERRVVAGALVGRALVPQSDADAVLADGLGVRVA